MNVVSSPFPAFSARDSSQWWRGATIYQIYPRSYRDTNGDGVGDLPGILEKLDYIAALGVDGIWISPFFTSPMKDFGYDVANYRDVDPLFGTLEDFDRILEKAHALGLKVIIDQVYSHTSDQHDWFEESRQSRDNPKADWYVWADAKPGGTPPNNWQSVFGGPSWTFDSRRRQYYMHNFLSSQPDLNLHNPAVQDALLEVARYWFDRGVDGFRLDAINFAMHDPALRDNPPVENGADQARTFDMQQHIYSKSHPDIVLFLERLQAVANERPGRFTLAEIGGLDTLSEMQAFTEGEARLNSAYSFEYLYADQISPELIRKTALDWPDRAGQGWPSWAFSNHDAPRCISRWYDGPHPDRYAKLMALLILTLRGNAIIYQGEELGLPQGEVPFDQLQDPEAIANWPETLGRDGARTPMPWTDNQPDGGFSTGRAAPWLPVDKRHVPLAAGQQEQDPESVLYFYRQVLALRRQYDALRVGEIRFHEAPEGCVVFERAYRDERLLTVLNLSDKSVGWQPEFGNLLLLISAYEDFKPAADQQDIPVELAAHSGYLARF